MTDIPALPQLANGGVIPVSPEGVLVMLGNGDPECIVPLGPRERMGGSS